MYSSQLGDMMLQDVIRLIENIVHMFVLQDAVSLLGIKVQKEIKRMKYKQQLLLCISIARSGKPNYKQQARCIPVN